MVVLGVWRVWGRGGSWRFVEVRGDLQAGAVGSVVSGHSDPRSQRIIERWLWRQGLVSENLVERFSRGSHLSQASKRTSERACEGSEGNKQLATGGISGFPRGMARSRIVVSGALSPSGRALMRRCSVARGCARAAPANETRGQRSEVRRPRSEVFRCRPQKPLRSALSQCHSLSSSAPRSLGSPARAHPGRLRERLSSREGCSTSCGLQ